MRSVTSSAYWRCLKTKTMGRDSLPLRCCQRLLVVSSSHPGLLPSCWKSELEPCFVKRNGEDTLLLVRVCSGMEATMSGGGRCAI